jgi:hypothetical protein
MRVLHGHFASEWFDWLFVSADELRKLVTGTGRILTDARGGYVAVLEKSVALVDGWSTHLVHNALDYS